MNRKQEIAAWLFGLILALGLLVTNNSIWALVVIAGLTILSLRDRKKKSRQKYVTAESAPDTPPVGGDQPLKRLTLHTLAVVMLQRRADGAMPFQEWKKSDAQVSAEAEAWVALSCECYQLRIFLDTVQRRFGSSIADLVESSIVSIMDSDSSGIRFFSQANAAILRARELCAIPDGPHNPALRIDIQVADQIQTLSGESEEKKALLRLPLAQCLSFARISAEAVFPDIVAKIDFDPASIAFVPRETAYRGATNRWSDAPGCFERHLQRKEANSLFAPSEQQPSDDVIVEARARDSNDLQKLKADVSDLGQTLTGYLDQDGIGGATLLDLLRYKIEPLIHRAAEIGELADEEAKKLVCLNESLMESIGDARNDLRKSLEAIQKDQQDLNNSFFAQATRSDTPIASNEFILTLLCESTETVKHVTEIMRRTQKDVDAEYRSGVQEQCKEAAKLLEFATEAGFQLPEAEDKLALLNALSAGATTAPA